MQESPEKEIIESAQKKKPTIKQMRRQLEMAGFKIIRQKPHQDSIEIDGEIVKLPFTNSYCEVALRKDGKGKWIEEDRDFEGRDFREKIKSLYETFISGKGSEDEEEG